MQITRVTCTNGKKKSTLENGKLTEEPVDKNLGSVFLPSNMPASVSADYLPSRKWAFVRDLAASATDYFGTASALNAVGIGSGPFTVGMAWMLRNGVDGVGKVAATTLAKEADRDPKAWTLRGEYAQTAGVVLETTLAVVPGAFLGLAPTAQIVKAFGSTSKGAAAKPIEVHQAQANNLGEVGSKNNVQNMVAGAIGGGMAFGLEALGKATLGPVSIPIMTAGFGALRLVAQHQYVKSLDMDQITEKAVGKTVRHWIETGDYSQPEKTKLFERKDLKDLRLGTDLEPFTQDIDDLRSLYAGRDYLLNVKDDKINVLLREGSTEQDQFAAVMQTVILKELKDGSTYRDKAAQNPQDADRWALETSLRATPSDPQTVLDSLREKGWEASEINFDAGTARATWEDGPAPTLPPLTREELQKLTQ